jgi:hypothetical protein
VSLTVLKAGILYFAFVFGAGFILGPIRLLWIIPHVGTRMAELLEMPVMLVVIIAAARWLIRHLAVPPEPSSRLGMGFLALVLLVVAEISLVGPLRGYSIDEYFSSRDPVSGTVYYVLLIVYALMPFLLAQRRNT